MSLLSRYLDGAYATWLNSAVICCGSQLEDTQARGVEKPMTILHHQPRLIPPPVPEPQHSRSSSHEWISRTKSFASRASSRGSFSVRRKLNAYNGPRRPHIGVPTDFRHVENALPRRTDRFRPLELSIYMPDNRLSPLLPHFGSADDEALFLLSYPAPALLHTRSESALSNFSIPRKPLSAHKSVHGRLEGLSIHTASSSLGSEWVSHPLQAQPGLPESPSAQELMAALQEELPQSSPHQARLRSNTEPPRMLNRESAQVDRVKLVLQEKIELEKRLQDLDSIIEERRSIYLSSRANSIYTVSEEPMPDLKTSEFEHLQRPKTAPARATVHIPVRAKSFTEASATFSAIGKEQPPPPPLPLVLQQTRPPLRKKKSFSRVSSWLFPSEHNRNISLESVTNTPKPVTSREGFYQCIDANPRRPSVSTMSTLESTIDEPTATTTWTANSSPNREVQKVDIELTRIATFGDKEDGMIVTREFGSAGMPIRISRVGVAF